MGRQELQHLDRELLGTVLQFELDMSIHSSTPHLMTYSDRLVDQDILESVEPLGIQERLVHQVLWVFLEEDTQGSKLESVWEVQDTEFSDLQKNYTIGIYIKVHDTH